MANEKRLIDANALMDDFRRYMVKRYDKEKCVSEENCKVCEKSCLWRKIVSYAPTVDAVEVVHGRWEEDEVEAGDPYDGNSVYCFDVMRCSVCGECFDVSAYNYCPNCGAKMDGERKDNERKAD